MTETWQPVAPTDKPIEDLSLDEWVGQALGVASSCWDNLTSAGVLDSTRCKAIYDALMAHINEVIDGVIAGTTEAVTCPHCGPCEHSGKREGSSE